MDTLDKLLSGGDLRSIGRVDVVIPLIRTQKDFDLLFKLLYHDDRGVALRAADAIEKITIGHRDFLFRHTPHILSLCHTAVNKEIKWHLAQILPRMYLNQKQLMEARAILYGWTTNTNNSRIVRANALLGLFDLADDKKDLLPLLNQLEQERIPSVMARIRQIRRQIVR